MTYHAVESAIATKAPVAVVDIGSNSVRLVVYDHAGRAPFPRFNEKIQCGLGRGLGRTGRLNEAGMAAALAAVERFACLARALDVAWIDMFATEAVRVAANGEAFVDAVVERTGQRPVILTGADEARYAALGIAAGFYEPDGLVGDIGGGSLELADLRQGSCIDWASLPLGALRLGDDCGGDAAKAVPLIDAQLASVGWLEKAGRNRRFFVVGGDWRALARLRLAERSEPLPIVHGLAMPRPDALDLLRRVTAIGLTELAAMPGMPQRRTGTLPMAALVLERLLLATKPTELVFSATGVREGRLLARLDQATAAEDPLLAGARAFGQRHGRTRDTGPAMLRWTAPLFPQETVAEQRLRTAACELADIAWEDHPDCRAAQASSRIAQLPLLGLGHGERAFLALTLHARHDGDAADPALGPYRSLVSAECAARAERLGRGLLLGFRLSGGVATVLERARLVLYPDEICLILPPEGAMPASDMVESRLRLLAKAIPVKRTRIAAAL